MEDTPSFFVMDDVYPMRDSTLAELPTVHGMENENMYAHINDFKALCQSLCEANTLETMQLTLFPFTMKDTVKIWLRSLPSLCIQT